MPLNKKPVTGMKDILPEEMEIRDYMISLIKETYRSFGFTPMETLLLDLKAHNLQNRTIGLIENGSWAAMSGKQMREILESMKNITVLEGTISLKSSVKEPQRQALEALADAIAAALA